MNHVVLIGRLVKDPELRYAPSGSAVVNFTLAIDRNYSKDRKAEMQSKGQPTADFIRVVAFGKTAELCGNYLSKGSQVAVNGSIQTSTYKSNTGETRYSTDVVATNIEFVGSKGDRPKSDTNDDFNFGNYNPDDFQAIEDDEDIPF